MRSDKVITVVNNLPDVVFRIDGDEQIRFLSGSAKEVFGIEASGCVGKTIAQAGLPASVTPAFHTVVRNALISGKNECAACSMSVSQQTEGQPLRHLTIDCVPESMESDGGKLQSLFIITHDVTNQFILETQCQESLTREKQAQRKADAAAQSRDQFLAVMSHELRSPLNGIQSWTHVLESTIATDQPVVKRALQGIKTGVTQQARLIDGLLDATMVLGGKISLTVRRYALNDVVRAAIDALSTEAREKEIEIDFNAELADDGMNGDAERIGQVVWNILSNAIKFTSSGGKIGVAVSRNDNEAMVTIQDNGIGVKPELVPQMFEPFRQGDSSYARSASGLGLGLAVSRNIVELHGGRITCTSSGVGHGSTFNVYLPAPR